MKERKKGISLISLVVTMLVIIILSTVMIQKGIDKINYARLASFDNSILQLKEEVNNYMLQNIQEYPAKTDENGNYIIYSITNNPELLEKATKKNDQNDIFYIVDLQKMNIDNSDIGVGKTIDDYYLVTKTSQNIYYAKGVNISNIVYYTKREKEDGVVAILPTSMTNPTEDIPPTIIATLTPTLTPTPIPTSTPTPAPGSGEWDGYVNSPKLAAGMTPVKWNGSAWVAADITNASNDWYDYHNTGTTSNKWANAKLVDGSLLVWIPRYTYQIASGEHTSTAGTINIRFSNGTTDDTTGGYREHPAFYWGGWDIPISAPMTKQAGGTEIKGIWVGKFETSDNGSGKIKIIDNVASWRTITVDSIFTTCKNMKNDSATYGDLSSVDTHMLKNSEWAAIAYLSKYVLGTTQVALNSNKNYITAYGGISTNKAQSTTGNEYGIYDMNGAGWDFVAAYVNNGTSNLTTYGNSLYIAEAKYKEVYPKAATDDQTSNYSAINQVFGHAIYETSSSYTGSTSWFAQGSNMPYTTMPWLVRGGSYSMSTGGLFFFMGQPGGANVSGGFRVGIVYP